MYSGRGRADPTEGRSQWHKLPDPGEREKPTLGALESKEYDEKHGRWWFTKKEEERPKLYTTIGRHARHPELKRTILRFAYGSKNFRQLKRDPYRKRWPKSPQICVRFFSEFALKPFEKRTMLETVHSLPLYGRGCKLWRAPAADCPDTRGQFFRVDSSKFKLRPIRGVVRGTQHYNGRPARSGIAAVAKSLGSWRYEYPAHGHPAVYRPSFPPSVAEDRKAAAAADAE